MYVCVGTALLLESVPYRMCSLTCLNPQCWDSLALLHSNQSTSCIESVLYRICSLTCLTPQQPVYSLHHMHSPEARVFIIYFLWEYRVRLLRRDSQYVASVLALDWKLDKEEQELTAVDIANRKMLLGRVCILLLI